MARVGTRPDTISVRLVALRAEPFSACFAPRTQTAWWRLSFREGGRADVATAERTFLLPPGRAVLIGPDIRPSAPPAAQTPHLLVGFELTPAKGTAIRADRASLTVLEPDPIRDELARGLLRELADAEPNAAHCARAQALLHLCLSSLLESAQPSDAGAHGPGHDARSQLQPVLRYIDAHLADLLPNSKLAELAHASESHFIRMFRRTLGRTPARHVQERRVSSAAELLVRTSFSIDEIAERCGFANRYHFSRVFAERMAHPPARFRALYAAQPPRPEELPALGNL